MFAPPLRCSLLRPRHQYVHSKYLYADNVWDTLCNGIYCYQAFSSALSTAPPHSRLSVLSLFIPLFPRRSASKPIMCVLPFTHCYHGEFKSPRGTVVLALHYTHSGIYAMAMGLVIPQNHKVRYLDRLSTALRLHGSVPRLSLPSFPYLSFLPSSHEKSTEQAKLKSFSTDGPRKSGRRWFIR